MKTRILITGLLLALLTGCSTPAGDNSPVKTRAEVPFLWDNASIYFLLTDRFYNGDPSNDVNFGRTGETALLRGFEGGDFRGIIQKMEEGYFDSLGVNALWFSPVVEQIHGMTDEGTGNTYGFHGYWTKDWTRLEPNFGTEAELKELVDKAHERGIRIIMDVVLNHTGPVTDRDPVWPDEWVRTSPRCDFSSYEGTVTCTLVENLPDIRTESDEPVDLPGALLEKWEQEGRLEQELAELNAFFEETGYPRAPKYYIIKWLIDLIKDYGVDGFRIDTAKHVEEEVWKELKKQADRAFARWKSENPEKVLDNNEFYMMGEVYNYNISSAFGFDFGDRSVNYFDFGFNSLINFEFRWNATSGYEELFSRYSNYLNGELSAYGVVNYISSHDDGNPFDKLREKPFESGSKLLLSPGTAQIYYGDETARPLDIPGTQGDATLRSKMNWEELAVNKEKNGYHLAEVLAHWRKLGRFRAEHPAVGAGVHRMVSAEPYFFTRSLTLGDYQDLVLVGVGLNAQSVDIPVEGIFADGTRVNDSYSGREYTVSDGKLVIEPEGGIALLAIKLHN